MKKVLLGLVLSAAMSGIAFANSHAETNDIKNDSYLADCSINTQTITWDSSGKVISNEVVITTGSGAECNDAMNGTVYALKMVRQRGPVQQVDSIQP